MSTQTQTQNKTQSAVRLKLVIDKKRKKILYGEADKKFVDFLFTILALPVGTVVKLLSTTAEDIPNKLGSLASLYSSVESLSMDDFEASHHKDGLLMPELPATTADSHIGSLLQIKSSLPPKTKYYTCTISTECRYNFSAHYGETCPICFNAMVREVTYLYRAGEVRPVVGGYVKGGTATYMVMDDLSVKPMSCSSMFFLSLLNDLKVESVEQVDEKLIYLNVEDGVNLLRASLHSSTVLTDLFLPRIDFSPYYSGTEIKKECMEDKN